MQGSVDCGFGRKMSWSTLAGFRFKVTLLILAATLEGCGHVLKLVDGFLDLSKDPGGSNIQITENFVIYK